MLKMPSFGLSHCTMPAEPPDAVNADVPIDDHREDLDSLLRSRREDPEEILLALGFGGGQTGREDVSPLTRIPLRFFSQQSKARGVCVTDVLRRRNQIFTQDPKNEVTRTGPAHIRRSAFRGRASQEKMDSKTVRKTLVMGAKRYPFDDEQQEVIHSPKTLEESSIADDGGIFFSKTKKETTTTTIKTPDHGGPVYRKLSCPVIVDELPAATAVTENRKTVNQRPQADFALIPGLLDVDVNSFFMMSSFIETSLLTSIQSLKMSLDFYRCFMFVGTGNGSCTAPDSERLAFQKLYLDVLEIETLLYECLFKFKHSNNWYVFITKYVHQLRKAMDKIFQIQLNLQKLSKCVDL